MIYFESFYLVHELAVRTADRTTDGAEFLKSYEDSEVLAFRMGNSREILVELWNSPDRVNTEGNAGYLTLCCKASSSKNPDDSIYAMFEALDENRLPDRFSVPKDSIEKSNNIDSDGRLKYVPPPMTWWSPQFRSFLGNTSQELGAALKHAVNMLRWRGAVVGPPNPFGKKYVRWSIDGQSWHDFYSMADIQVTVELLPSSTAHVTDRISDELETLVNDAPEPVGHTVFREAWAATNARNRIIVGVAALEIRVKEFIAGSSGFVRRFSN